MASASSGGSGSAVDLALRDMGPGLALGAGVGRVGSSTRPSQRVSKKASSSSEGGVVEGVDRDVDLDLEVRDRFDRGGGGSSS